jgi:hypothetical protein
MGCYIAGRHVILAFCDLKQVRVITMEYPSNLAGLVDELLYRDKESVALDIYFHERGHPAQLHDIIGGTEALAQLTQLLIEQIKNKNGTSAIWQVSGYGFAVEHDEKNCPGFVLNIQGIPHKITKKTMGISVGLP